MLSNMQLARQPLRQALRAGFVAFMLCWLVSAVQVLPILSLHQDFGHRHPPDTPFHSHAITLVFQVAAVAVVIIGIPSTFDAPYQGPSYLSPYIRNLALLGFNTRAPPCA
jgi:cellobiose-specific phosphotransferase system component IIC